MTSGRGPTIKQALHDIYLTHNKAKVSEKAFSNEVEWFLYNPSPSYLTDGETCIMFEICGDTKHPLPIVNVYPTNRTPYYNTFKDCLKLFNCPDEMVDEANTQDQYPLPYTPFFHFRQKFTQFRQERTQKLSGSTRCPILTITQWQVVWVNISNTGYIAPIIRIYKYTKRGEKVIPNNKIHSILYDELTKQHMIDYWQSLVQKTLPPEVKVRTFKLAGLIGSVPPKKENLPFLNVDLHNTLLKGATHRTTQTFILMNNKELIGDHFAKQSIIYQQPQQKMAENLLNYTQKHLNKIFYDNVVPEGQSSMSDDLEDSEDDPLKDYHELEDKVLVVSGSQEEQSSNEEDNYLRKLYKNMLKNNQNTNVVVISKQSPNNIHGNEMIAEEQNDVLSDILDEGNMRAKRQQALAADSAPLQEWINQPTDNVKPIEYSSCSSPSLSD